MRALASHCHALPCSAIIELRSSLLLWTTMLSHLRAPSHELEKVCRGRAEWPYASHLKSKTQESESIVS